MGYVEELRSLIGHRPVNLNGSAVIIENEKHQILLQQRKHPHGKWGLPGGLMELGESTEETARREVYEETGLHVDNLKLLGVYSGKGYLCRAGNGDEWYVVMTVYYTRDYSGRLCVNDDESISLEFFDIEKLPDNVAGTHLIALRDYLKAEPRR